MRGDTWFFWGKGNVKNRRALGLEELRPLAMGYTNGWKSSSLPRVQVEGSP